MDQLNTPGPIMHGNNTIQTVERFNEYNSHLIELDSIYICLTYLKLGSSSLRICLFTKSSKETSGTNSAGLGPLEFLIAVRISIDVNPNQNKKKGVKSILFYTLSKMAALIFF